MTLESRVRALEERLARLWPELESEDDDPGTPEPPPEPPPPTGPRRRT